MEFILYKKNTRRDRILSTKQRVRIPSIERRERRCHQEGGHENGRSDNKIQLAMSQRLKKEKKITNEQLRDIFDVERNEQHVQLEKQNPFKNRKAELFKEKPFTIAFHTFLSLRRIRNPRTVKNLQTHLAKGRTDKILLQLFRS